MFRKSRLVDFPATPRIFLRPPKKTFATISAANRQAGPLADVRVRVYRTWAGRLRTSPFDPIRTLDAWAGTDNCIRSDLRASGSGLAMKRRQFIGLVGGAMA